MEPTLKVRSEEEVRTVAKVGSIPAYGKRKGWIPRKPEDFGDGGAFPEIHVAQYPLNMGRKTKSGGKNDTVALTLDSSGKVRYDAIVRQGVGEKIVYSRAQDLVPLRETQEKLPERPDEEAVAETMEKTKKALERILEGKERSSHLANVEGGQRGEANFVRYQPASRGSVPSQARVVRIVEKPVDPLEPPKFKHKRVPNGPPSPPVPVMHSPPRKLNKQEQQEWNIPPCISNWKNPGGYTIPLDKRLAADGRGLQDNTINDNFAKFSEAMYLAERNAREEVRRRAELRKAVAMQEKKSKEEMIRELARETRKEKRRVEEESRSEGEEEREAVEERERVRRQLAKEKERERKLRNAGRLTKEKERDISEKIALGESVAMTEDNLYDQRLFNQSAGLDSGFAADDTYDTFDKPLFEAATAASLYKPRHVDLEESDSDAQVKKILDTSRFKPNVGFSGSDKQEEGHSRSGPVQFEREVEEKDMFGIEQFLNDAKSGSRKPLHKIGNTGGMSASSSSSRESYQNDKRKHRDVSFESDTKKRKK